MLTVSAIVVFLIFSTLSAVLAMRRFSVRTVEDFSTTVLLETNTKIESFLAEIENLARSLAAMRIVYEIDEPDLKNVFVASVAARNRFVRAIYVGTVEGAMHEYGIGAGFVDFEPDLPEDYDPRVRPWYENAIAAGDYAVSAPYLYASEPVLGITGAIPVRDPGGRLVGVLGIDLMLDNLRTLLWDLRIPKDGKAVLISRNGRVIASQYAHHQMDALELPPFDPPLFERISRSAAGHFEAEYAGTRTIFSYTTDPSSGWILLLGLPYRSIVADSNEVLLLILASNVVLVLLFLMGQSMINNSVIVAPLNALMNVVARLQRGEHEARAPADGDDEFAVLGRELNELADAVAEYTEEMEEKVQSGTRALLELEEENTRLRIMRDVHDTLGARLTNISICTSVALAVPEGLPDKAREMLHRIDVNTREAIDGLESVIIRGKPLDETLEFGTYLETRVRRRLALREIDLRLSVENDRTIREQPKAIRDFLRFVVDELVTNVLKHTRAHTFSISLIRSGPDEIRLDCTDDGQGFIPWNLESLGTGLRGIRARTESLSGTLTIESDAEGTRVSISIPLRGNE